MAIDGGDQGDGGAGEGEEDEEEEKEGAHWWVYQALYDVVFVVWLVTRS